MQVHAGVERVRGILLAEDKDMAIVIPPDAFSYIDVLPEMVGYVLGSRGSTVKTLKEKTGTQIQITDINPDTGLQAILIKGKPENISEAHHTVVKMLERFDPRRTRPPPIGGPPAPLMGPGGYGPPPGYGPDPYAPDLDAGPMGPPGYGPPPYGYDDMDRYGPPGVDAPPPPYMRGGRDRYAPEDPWMAPPRAAPQYSSAAGGYGSQPPAAAPAAAAAAPAVAAAPAADPNAPPGSTPQVLILQPDGTYRAAQIMVGGGAQYTQPPAGSQPLAASQPLTVSAAMAVQPQQQQPLAYTSAAMQQPQYPQPAQYLQPAQQQAAAQPQASPAPAQPQPAAAVALPTANGAAAAPATAAAAAPATSGSMTLQQMQQYYSMYAQMYQQAQQQMQQQPAAQQ
ncbi:hypothetical protein DUNSADRAFT_9713 [Dunaliella salina]|uniref:K Homology domain-containing protein n=1 Tax=Dunaliella salina TaxID=3046 RepID=A0ABQ7GGW1_DUNSA|nr:hypothetical protein DUNSADRAFT_9713 [Dunaliella salina]|eukprot:KAF5833839.1 hypothetical protein DUNSADRAFT_9713 [Dunaliella salina]